MEPKRNNKVFYTIPFVWSKTLWVMTFAVFALWLGLSGYVIVQIITEANAAESVTTLLVVNLIFLPMTIICEGLAPQRLEIGEDKIVILRRYKSVVLPREQIKSVTSLPSVALRGAIRTFGVGGFFGYFGQYYTSSVGSFTLYATSFENLFLIKKWDGKSIVVSCAEPERMWQFIEQ